MAPNLTCDPDGMRAFALECEEHAGQIGPHEHTDLPRLPEQATAAAVAGLHAATAHTAFVLADRIRSTAAAVTSAADQYTRTDEDSGSALAATMAIDMH